MGSSSNLLGETLRTIWLVKIGILPRGATCILLGLLALNYHFLLAKEPDVVSPKGPSATKKIMPLAEAVRHIAHDASLDLVYADDLLRGMAVEFAPNNAAELEQLEGVLAGTDITYKVNQQQRLILYRNKALQSRRLAGYVVTAKGGGAIVGAHVSIPGTKRVTQTDATGAFTMKGVPVAFTQIEIAAKGLATRTMDVGPTDDSQMVIVLSQVMEMTEKLRVFAPKRTRLNISPLTGKWSLTSDESFQEGPPGWDLFDSLKELPGVNAGTGESGLEFRGGQPSENLVLLDGIQLFQFDHALGAFSALNADAIGEIEVFKGGYPANYGDRLSGVLSLTTRKDMFDDYEVRFGVDRDKADLTAIAPLGSKLAVLVSARQSISDDITASTFDRNFEATFNQESFFSQNVNGFRYGREIGFSDFIGKVSYRPTVSDTVNLTVYSGQDDVGETISYFGLPANSYIQDGVLKNKGYSLHWDRLWTANLETTFRASLSKYESKFFTQYLDWDEFDRRYVEFQGIPPLPYAYLDEIISTELENASIDADAIWQVAPNHQLRFGISETDKSIYIFDDGYYREEPSTSLQETNLSSIYAQDQWQMTPWLSALLGVRFVNNSLSKTDFTEPRISFKVERPGASWSLRGSWGEYNQHLLRSPDNLNYFSGLETWFLAFQNLRPATSRQTQIGGSWKIKDWHVDLEFFHRNQRGSLFQIYEPPATDLLVHQSKDRIKGLDLLIHQKRGSFSSFLGYSYQDAKVLEDITYGIPLSHPTDRSRPHQVHLAFNYSRGPWRTMLAWRYATGLPYSIPNIGFFINEEGNPEAVLIPSEETNNFRLPDAHQLDARIQYTFGWKRFHGNLGLYLFNIYDRNNPLYRYYNLDDGNVVPVDVPGFKFRPSIRLQIVY